MLDSAAVSPGREDGFHSQSQVDAWEGTDWGSFSQQDGSVHACRMVSPVCRLQRLISLFLGISVDLFTTFENKRLPSFVSPFPDERALAVDALSLSWEGLKAYAFPPFKIIGPVPRKIQEDQGFVFLIAPAWAGQA